MELKKFITRLLYFSIAIAGVFTAGVILFSSNGDIVENSIATTFLIILADVFIIIGLFAKYNWLKITTWAMSIYSLVIAVVYTWIAEPEVSYNYGRLAVSRSYEDTLKDTLADLTFGGYIITIALVVASLFSLLDKIANKDKTLTGYSYIFALALGISSGLALALAASLSDTGLLMRFGFALMFLAFTSSVIMGITLASNFIRTANETRIKTQERLREQYNNNFPNQPQPAHYNQHPGYPNPVSRGHYPQQPNYNQQQTPQEFHPYHQSYQNPAPQNPQSHHPQPNNPPTSTHIPTHNPPETYTPTDDPTSTPAHEPTTTTENDERNS